MVEPSPRPERPDRTDRPEGRGPDPVTLVAGLVALAVAGLPVLGRDVVAAVDPRWILAVAALVVGVLVLLSSVRRRG